jgi:hypothetical protein
MQVLMIQSVSTLLEGDSSSVLSVVLACFAGVGIVLCLVELGLIIVRAIRSKHFPDSLYPKPWGQLALVCAASSCMVAWLTHVITAHAWSIDLGTLAILAFPILGFTALVSAVIKRVSRPNIWRVGIFVLAVLYGWLIGLTPEAWL